MGRKIFQSPVLMRCGGSRSVLQGELPLPAPQATGHTTRDTLLLCFGPLGAERTKKRPRRGTQPRTTHVYPAQGDEVLPVKSFKDLLFVLGVTGVGCT